MGFFNELELDNGRFLYYDNAIDILAEFADDADDSYQEILDGLEENGDEYRFFLEDNLYIDGYDSDDDETIVSVKYITVSTTDPFCYASAIVAGKNEWAAALSTLIDGMREMPEHLDEMPS